MNVDELKSLLSYDTLVVYIGNPGTSKAHKTIPITLPYSIPVNVNMMVEFLRLDNQSHGTAVVFVDDHPHSGKAAFCARQLNNTQLSKDGHFEAFSLETGLDGWLQLYEQLSESEQRAQQLRELSIQLQNEGIGSNNSSACPITNQLYISSISFGNSADFSHVVNLCRVPQGDTPNHLNLPIEDNRLGVDKIDRLFSKFADFVDRALLNDQAKILVRCQAGISRSSTFSCLYLMRDMSLLEAFLKVFKARPIIRPNEYFCRVLQERDKGTYKLATYFMLNQQDLIRMIAVLP